VNFVFFFPRTKTLFLVLADGRDQKFIFAIFFPTTRKLRSELDPLCPLSESLLDIKKKKIATARTPLSLFCTYTDRYTRNEKKREKDLKYLKAWKFGAQSRRRWSRGVRFGGFIFTRKEFLFYFLRVRVCNENSLPLLGFFFAERVLCVR